MYINKKLEAPSTGNETYEAITTEDLINGGIDRGLGFEGLSRFTVGQLVDYCISYNNNHGEKKSDKDSVRKANQSDWDKFCS